jgi:hypothetical protein
MILNKKRKIENKNIDQIMYFIRRVHDMADFYQNADLTPKDFISSHPDLLDIVVMNNKYRDEKLNINNLTWAAACSFVIFNSNEYINLIKNIDLSEYKRKIIKH